MPTIFDEQRSGAQVKKGRHRRFEEARALKRSTEPRVEPCPECGALPGDDHASWCLHDEVDDIGEDDDETGPDTGPAAAGPPGDAVPRDEE